MSSAATASSDTGIAPSVFPSCGSAETVSPPGAASFSSSNFLDNCRASFPRATFWIFAAAAAGVVFPVTRALPLGFRTEDLVEEAATRELVLPPRAPAAPRTVEGGVASLSVGLPPRMRGRLLAELSASDLGEGFVIFACARAVLWFVLTDATDATDASSSIKIASPAKLSSSSCAFSGKLEFRTLVIGDCARLDCGRLDGRLEGLLEGFRLELTSTDGESLMPCRPEGGLLGTGELSLEDGRFTEIAGIDGLSSAMGVAAGGGERTLCFSDTLVGVL